jgi:V/A-type H+/Na+-transporting ATPase subunit I
MLRPRTMRRTLIIGAKQDLEQTIALLHHLDTAHIIDYPAEGEEGLQRGTPIGKASEMSRQLVTLRSSSQILGITPEAGEGPEQKLTEEQVKEKLHDQLQNLELTVFSLTEKRKKFDEQLHVLSDNIELLLPFTKLDLPIEDYQGFNSVVVFTGLLPDAKRFAQQLQSVTDEYEFFYATESDAAALFVARPFADEAKKLLIENGFLDVILPIKEGLPRTLVENWKEDKAHLQEDIEHIDTELSDYRQKHKEFILASEEYLTIQVEKAEAPVRFATTEHSFIIDCWIPEVLFPDIKKMLDEELHESLDIVDYPVTEGEEPPTMLDNSKPVRRFEFLLKLYSTPDYHDIDPTIFLATIFPLFFGLMVGDVGYGILLIVFGFIFMRFFKNSEVLPDIGFYIVIAGVFSMVFGLFLFGDMFGLPFMAQPGEAYSWSGLIGTTIPIESRIVKMEALGLSQLLVISIIAGFLHLFLGLILGFFSERRHNKRHAYGKIGLIFILIALTVMIFVVADWTIGQWLKPLRGTSLEPFLWGFLIPIIKSGFVLGSLIIPYVTIGFGLIGVAILLIALGGFGMIEVLEITGHLISYTRLAAICVAKGAMAFAFNIIGLGLILSGNIIIGIIGIVLMVIMQMLVFALGSLSSGIQAVRLHYVEFFMKFFKGDGKAFTPFGYIRKYTKKQPHKEV